MSVPVRLIDKTPGHMLWREEELHNYFITHKISNFSHNSWRVQTKTPATFDIFLLPNFYNLCPRMFSISSVQTSYYEQIWKVTIENISQNFNFVVNQEPWQPRLASKAKINNSASSALFATQFQTFRNWQGHQPTYLNIFNKFSSMSLYL